MTITMVCLIHATGSMVKMKVHIVTTVGLIDAIGPTVEMTAHGYYHSL